MTENNISMPLLIPFKQTSQEIHLSGEPTKFSGMPVNLTNYRSILQQQTKNTPQQPQVQIIEETNMHVSQETNTNNQMFVYQIVYPEQLNLKPVFNLKRGRPRKKKIHEAEEKKPEVVSNPPKTARTRSGRLVKLPKHIERDFKQIGLNDEPEGRTTEFVRYEHNEAKKKLTELERHQKKRTVAAQYRCPKCQKAYLGKCKMVQHLKKYPDHGPLPEGYTSLNFDVWNYLVDITQKCPPGKRGSKFCEELTNLLHNVQLLTSALFKILGDGKNSVQVDKVLGNAIGLPAGEYKFDENELYKDVTILKLITNSEFFNTRKTDTGPDTNMKVLETTTQENNKSTVTDKHIKKVAEEDKGNGEYFPENINLSSNINFTENMLENNFANQSHVIEPMNSLAKHAESNPHLLITNQEPIFNEGNNHNTQYQKFENSSINSYNKKANQTLDNRLTLHSDLLSDNSLLNSLPHSSVEELMLPGVVDTSSHLLDNSASSDEVMNVDQFVNERFKKITEPDIDVGSGSLNLDLPTLDLFSFHTS